jgi:hypothetical protein
MLAFSSGSGSHYNDRNFPEPISGTVPDVPTIPITTE